MLKFVPLTQSSSLQLPFFSSTVAAGFPSPADDYIEIGIDINKLLVANPSATFLVQASGKSMIEAGIFDGDLLVVDRSLSAEPNDIVIAYNHNEFLVKRLVQRGNLLYLAAENRHFAYKPMQVTEQVVIWGVVRAVVRPLRK
jgi:DNA polymerase V